MDADTIFLALRVVVALGVVLAVLWILRRRLAKGAAKPAARRAGARRAPLSIFGRAPQGPTAAVRGRHALGQKSSVAVVEFDGREFLLGVTEHGVTVLHRAGSDEELDGVDDLVEEPSVRELPAAEPVAIAATEVPEVVAAVAPAPAEAPLPDAPLAEAPAASPADPPVAEPAPDWAALFARELIAAQRAMVAEQAAAAAPAEPAPAPVSEPAPAAPALAHEPATVFAPRYARSTALTPALVEDEIDPASGLVPQPLPVRTVITGQFVAEVELMPLPTSAIPIVPAAAPAAAPVAPTPAPALAPAAPAPAAPAAARPSASAVLPITAMIPTITIPARPAPAPIPAPVAAPPQPEPVAATVIAPAAPRQRPAASPLAGSILSPDTWRQTVDAFRQLR